MSRVIEDVARDYARSRVESLRNEPIDVFGQSVRFLNPRDAERFAGWVTAQQLAAGMIEAFAAAKKAADGDPMYFHALALLAALELRGEIRLEYPLRGYVISTLVERPKLKTAPKRETNVFRDIAITMLVQELCEGFELKPTSSAKAGRGGCACGIAAEAMGLSYDAVCKVWGRLGHAI